jgi:hypothetical protein
MRRYFRLYGYNHGSRAKESDIGSWKEARPDPPARPDIVRDIGEESPDSSDATDDEEEVGRFVRPIRGRDPVIAGREVRAAVDVIS